MYGFQLLLSKRAKPGPPQQSAILTQLQRCFRTAVLPCFHQSYIKANNNVVPDASGSFRANMQATRVLQGYDNDLYKAAKVGVSVLLDEMASKK